MAMKLQEVMNLIVWLKVAEYKIYIEFTLLAYTFHSYNILAGVLTRASNSY